MQLTLPVFACHHPNMQNVVNEFFVLGIDRNHSCPTALIVPFTYFFLLPFFLFVPCSPLCSPIAKCHALDRTCSSVLLISVYLLTNLGPFHASLPVTLFLDLYSILSLRPHIVHLQRSFFSYPNRPLLLLTRNHLVLLLYLSFYDPPLKQSASTLSQTC